MTRHGTSARVGCGLALVAALTGALLTLRPGTAAAGDFGQHVRQCAQEHGFDGSHNPGVRQGATGMDHAGC